MDRHVVMVHLQPLDSTSMSIYNAFYYGHVSAFVNRNFHVFMSMDHGGIGDLYISHTDTNFIFNLNCLVCN